jgi:hypothetical protein
MNIQKRKGRVQSTLAEARQAEMAWVKRGSILGLSALIRFSRGKQLSLASGLIGILFVSAVAVAATGNMTSLQVLADGCKSVPANFVLSEFWNDKMQVLGASCDYPSIAASHINGSRKPQAFVFGSAGSAHDASAILSLNGQGTGSSALGTAPGTVANFGSFCTDSTPVLNGREGDVAFSLRAWSNDCQLKNSSLPTILVFGKNNANEYVGNSKDPGGVQVSAGANYGLAIDYFTPGGASTILGGGNVSYALPEFAGIIVALNTALISAGKPALNSATIKEVLDASSDEVYLQVGGYKGIYKENQLSSLLSKSGTRYYGQIVNLDSAIEYALNGSAPPPPPPPPSEKNVAALLIPIYALLLDE